MMEFYAAYGLLIGADLELPLQHSDQREPDVVVRRDDSLPLASDPLDRRASGVLASLGSDEDPWYVATREPDGVRFSVRRTAEFWLDASGSQILWRKHPHGEQDMVSILLSGTVLALALMLRDRLVLHASAVTFDERALAFVGHSGRGKSTMAALGASWGARILSDDVLVIDGSRPPRCTGNAGEIRLRPAAQEVLRDMPSGTAHRRTFDDRLALLSERPHAGWVELGAIVVPRPSREADRVQIEPVKPSLAALWLLSMPRISGIAIPDLARRQFEQHAELCANVPVYDVTIPWGPPFRAEVFDQLSRLLERPAEDIQR